MAENLTDKQALKRIEDFRPKLICFVVYGQNVNSGSTNMSGVRLAKYLKKNNINTLISFIGSHVQALPKNFAKESVIDFVFLNEAVYSLNKLLKLKKIDFDSISKISGLALK